MNDKISKFPVGQVEKMIATDRENGVKELVTLIESGCKKYEEQTGVKLSRIFVDFKEKTLDYVLDILSLVEEDKKQGTADYDKDERQAKDFQRSKSHDALISDITSLRRNMAEKGIDTSWADNLFDNSEPNRNAIKTFAVKTAYYLVKKAMRQVESE